MIFFMMYLGLSFTLNAIITIGAILAVTVLYKIEQVHRSTVLIGVCVDVRVNYWSRYRNRYPVIRITENNRVVKTIEAKHISVGIFDANVAVGRHYEVFKIPTSTGYEYKTVKGFWLLPLYLTFFAVFFFIMVGNFY